MRTILLAALLALGGGAGCSKSETTSAHVDKVPLISVDDVDKQLARGECVPVDANGDKTRKKMGFVPGAVLLSDSDTFSISELPADKAKPLVFYCANNHCGASHDAAGKAMTAGYKNVKVMNDGIAGWVKAGKQVATL